MKNFISSIFFKQEKKTNNLCLKMKLTLLVFLATLFQVQANTYSQNVKVTLNVKNGCNGQKVGCF